MNIQQSIFASVLILIITSCSPSTYFQVFKATSTENIEIIEDVLIFEDANCKLIYNLWSAGGNVGFKLYNKTNENIYLNLEESFFILNGMANNYYKNRTFGKSISKATSASNSGTGSKSLSAYNFLNLLQSKMIAASRSVGIINSNQKSVSYQEEKIVVIPAKTAKVISEYIVNDILYRTCGLLRYPSAKHASSKTYNKEDSPLIFSNRIYYNLENNKAPIKFENEFFINEITNYPEKSFYGYAYEEFCGKRSSNKIKHLKYDGPNKFYLKYSKGTDTSKY